MRKKAKKSAYEVEKKKKEYKQGRAYAREWMLTSTLLDIRELIDAIGWFTPPNPRTPSAYCPLPDLRVKLKLHGTAFGNGFLKELLVAFQASQPALAYHWHHEGVSDGRRWGTELASQGQLARMRDFSIDPDSRYLLLGQHVGRVWTPAHELVSYLFDDAYPVDDHGEMLGDCTEFREFWHPFVNEPMDEVMLKLKAISHRGCHKLEESSYVTGFVNGALGLSEQLSKRIAEESQLQSQIAENDLLTC